MLSVSKCLNIAKNSAFKACNDVGVSTINFTKKIARGKLGDQLVRDSFIKNGKECANKATLVGAGIFGVAFLLAGLSIIEIKNKLVEMKNN